MRIADLELYRDILRDQAGLKLDDHQTFLLESRLTPVAKEHGYPSLAAMTIALRGFPDNKILQNVAKAVTITDTGFFHSPHLFDAFADTALPHLYETRKKQRSLRFWVAGAATGEEAYTLAILLEEAAQKFTGWKIEILATDLSDEALTKAERGIYTQAEVQNGLPTPLLIKYFDRIGKTWRASAPLKRLISWHELNLVQDFSELGPFDAIFCCNVLPYLDPAARENVLSRFTHQLAPDGFFCTSPEEPAPAFFKSLKPDTGLYTLSDS